MDKREETQGTKAVFRTKKNLSSVPSPPLHATRSGPSSSGMYKTTQLRKERYKKVGSCRSAPLHDKATKTFPEIKSHSSTNLIEGNKLSQVSSNASNLDSPILAYIKYARDALGLETKPMQNPSTSEELRESLLVSSGPITGVKDLKNLSRRLSDLSQFTAGQATGDASVEFVYALSKENNRGCAVYDIYITRPERARTQKRYYTVSAFNVSEVDKHGSMESISSLRWLWECDMFRKISSISYFKNFKIRKAFLIWQQWLSHKKRSKHLVQLRSDLFSADVLLQKTITHIWCMCESASSSSFSHYFDSEQARSAKEIKFINVSEKLTYTLDDFVCLQEEALSQAKQDLLRLREEVVTVINAVCQEVVDKERISGLATQSTSEDAPSHTQVLEWRVTLERLERFVRLCGNLVLQLLQRLALKAVTSLLFLMNRSVKQAQSQVKVQDESFHKMREVVTSNPFTQGILDRHDISLDDEEEDGTDHMGLVSLQASSFSSLLPSLETGVGSLSELIDSTVPVPDDPLSADASQHDLSDISELFKKPAVPILPLWELQLTLEEHSVNGQTASEVSFSPTADQFKSVLTDLLNRYESLLEGFESFPSDERILPFISSSRYDLLKALEEEADKEKKLNKVWIDCHSLLRDYVPYRNAVDQLRKCVTVTIVEVQRKIKHYKCYCKMVNLCKSVDIASSLSCEAWTVPMFQRAFALYHDQVYAMEGMVLLFQVGMVEVRADEYQRVCMTSPQRILALLEHQLPMLANAKCDQLSSEMKMATEKMLELPSNVSSFVQYLEDVDSVSSSISGIEKRLVTATNMHNVAQQFEVEVDDEEVALYKSLFPQFRHLKNVLMQAQAIKSESVYQFSVDLRTQVVDVLKQAGELKMVVESPALLEEGLQESSDKPLEVLGECEVKLNLLLSRAKDYMNYHHIFGTIPSSSKRFHAVDPSAPTWTPEEVHDEVVNVSHSLKARQRLFEVQQDWRTKLSQWTTVPIASLSVSEMQKEVNGFINQVDCLEKELTSSNKIVSTLQVEVRECRTLLPTLSCLLNPALKMRHWDVIHQTVGETTSLAKGESLTISYLQNMKVFDHHSAIASVSNEANHEAALENMLKKVSGQWLTRELVLVAHVGVAERPTHVLGGVEDLLASIEDSLLTINTLNSSRYVTPIKHSVLDWQRRLVLMLDTVECWIHCQKNWLYLESIFAAVDLQRQLSSEAKLFLQADKSLREVIRVLAEKPTALKATTTPGVLESFQSCSVLLEQVFKSLEDFLESKRVGFPRFYFISNEELLDILAHTKQPLTVQAYLGKLFSNIKRLDSEVVNPAAATVHALVSNEGERIQLYRNVSARGPPEKWLCSLEATCCETVRRLLKDGVGCYDEALRVEWALNQPGQVSLAVALMEWTSVTEKCLESDSSMDSLKTLLEKWNRHITTSAKTCETDQLSALKQGMLASLLTLDVHCRDIIQQLWKDRISAVNSFQWNRHLRHYWDDKSHCCYLQQLCAQFPYGNEYLGCLTRLVVTPLTERCYLTLTTALHLHLGGLLLGPAGTGKSESVKDLAKAMGRFCLLINCSDSLDYKVIGQIFSGLCQSGSWCCFDEFNRISVDVLSVLAQQLKCIKDAKERKANWFLFEGKEIKMNATCAAFITMNPSYTGRVALPDNIKVFFRPVAMMKPDTAAIAEVLLFSCGFTSAFSLARKLTTFFKFMESQISKQAHYDFGLRAVKAVVLASRINLVQRKRSAELVEASAGVVETQSLVSAVLELNLSKLLSKDIIVMHSLLEDLFGMDGSKVAHLSKQDDLLKEHLEQVALESSLHVSDAQARKCVQLFQSLIIRHGVVILGQTGTGKTTIIQLLKRALNFAGNTSQSETTASIPASNKVQRPRVACELETINPKCVSIDELYGYVDKNTLEWKHGILPKILKKYCDQLSTDLLLPTKEDADIALSDSSSSVTFSSSYENSEQETQGIIDSDAHINQSVKVALCFPPSAPAGWKMIVLDGPVDPMWIENLNSVLDDSKLLCLSNNERISLQPGVRLLFETDSLDEASPATVSRCGMVFMDTQYLCWRQFFNSWMDKLPVKFPEECKSHLNSLVDQSIEEGNQFLRMHKSHLCCPLSIMGAVKTLCSILIRLIEYTIKELPQLYEINSSHTVSRQLSQDSSSGIGVQTLAGIYIPNKVSRQKKDSTFSSEVSSKSKLFDLIGKLYVFSFTWAYGGCFESVQEEEDVVDGLAGYHVTRGGTTARSKFDALVHKIFSASDSVAHVQLPASADLIFSYYVDIHTSSFVQWKNLVPSPKQIATRVSLMNKGLGNLGTTSSSPFFDECGFTVSHMTATSVPLIPTVPVLQLTYLASLLSQNPNNSLLIAGQVGVGKTQFLNYLLDTLLSTDKRSKILSSLYQAAAKRSYSMFIKSEKSITVTDDDNSTSVDPGFMYQLSTRTTSPELQSIIESHCTRTSLSALKPSMGEKVVAFLDDLNIPATDRFASQQCSELLRQLLDQGGWYDRRNFNWKDVYGIQIVATCGRQGWGYVPLSERCLGKFRVFCLPEPSSDSLHSVYSAHLFTAFTANKFSEEVVKCIPNLVSCTIFVLQEIITQMKPTPTRPQYTFCTRDLSKVFSRMLHVGHRSLKTAQDAIQLLSHEIQRVFKDKCCHEDRDKILHILSEGLRINFKVVVPIRKLKEQILLYEDFTSSVGGYSLVKNPKKFVKNLERIQSQYNLTNDKNFQLSFFTQVCEHIVRITRILQQHRGNLILIGEGGLGKRSCVQLAAHIAKCSCHCLAPSEESPAEVVEEIKSVVLQCGVSDQSTCLLATENLGSAQKDVLCTLHVLVRGGELRSLFSGDEVESILSQMSEVMVVKEGSGYQLSSRELWSSFVDRVFANLHVIFCLTPSSPVLTLLYTHYQSVLTHSTVDLFDEWNSKALFGLAAREIIGSGASRSNLKLKESTNQLAAIAVKMHTMVLSAQAKAHSHSPLSFTITPATFIQFVQRFCTLFLEGDNNSVTKRSHLEAGLIQLQKTNKYVDQMKAELSCLHPEVESKAKEVESLLCQLTVEQQQVDNLRSTVAEERATIAVETEQVLVLKKEAGDDLSKVLPAMREAEKGLKTLKKTDLQEIRSYGSPPSMVVHVMSAVCLLLGQPTDWGTAKHLMTDPAIFLKSLTTIDKDNVPDKVLSKLKKYTHDPNFTPDNVAHYSLACQSFCQWVLAIEEYAKVYRVVQPKRTVYQEVVQKLEVVKLKLRKKEDRLHKLEQQMSELEEQHRIKMEERNILQSRCDEISLKLHRAESVLQSLVDEQVRWTDTLSFLDHQEVTLIGDTLLTAACLTYLGPFTVLLRQALITKWKQLCLENKTPVSESFKLEDSAGDLEQIQQWYVSGLPNDPHSVQNALITAKSTFPPLLIDPQGQATRWIKNWHSVNLKVLEFSNKDLIKDIKESVIAGTPVLVEDVLETICTKLEPFLTKQLETRDGQMLLKIGKTEIPYNPSFRLFLVCSKANASLSSEVCNKTTVINFACTAESLMDQLLSIVIRLVQPELDSTYSELMLEIASNRRELRNLEEDLLNILSTSEGNVLEDEEILTALQHVKEVALNVKGRLEAAQGTERNIVSSRQQYLPVAARGSLLYDEIQSLQSLSSLYHFSMDWFQQIFSKCILDSLSQGEECKSQGHIAILTESVTLTILKRTSFGISSEHYTPFVFKVCCSICMTESADKKLTVHPDEWKAMIKVASLFSAESDSQSKHDTGGREPSIPKKQTSVRPSKPSFVGQNSWDAIFVLEKHLPCFSDLQNHINTYTQLWLEYMACLSPLTFFQQHRTLESEHCKFMPSALSCFQNLLLIQVLHPEHFVPAVKTLVGTQLGTQYQEKQPVLFSELLKNTNHKIPFMLVVSDGIDPSCLLQDLVLAEVGDTSSLVVASIGKGQKQRVMDLLHSAVVGGNWVLLENCHLATTWIGNLESYSKSLRASSQVHTNFRWFFCCKPTTTLPRSLLASCVKVYLDAPSSIRSSMLQLFSTESSGSLSKDLFQGGSHAPIYWKELVYHLCLFHSAINARKRFRRVGWRAVYDFQMADLQVATTLLIATDSVHWEAVKHLVGDICYGGRMTNTNDRACLHGLLHMYCNKPSLPDNRATCRQHTLAEIEPSTLYSECFEVINNLPPQDEPSLVGLSPGIWLSHKQEESRRLQYSLSEIEYKSSTKIIQSSSSDDVVLERASKILEKLASLELTEFPRHDSHLSDSCSSSLYIELMTREVSEWKDRLSCIRETLYNVMSAMKGKGLFLVNQQKIYRCLLMNAIPENWTFEEEESSLSISQWLEQLTTSVKSISRLSREVFHAYRNDKAMPRIFSISAFASPKGLFTFLKQFFSRAQGIPLEEVEMRVLLASESTKLPSLTVILGGLTLEGADFHEDKGIVTTSEAGAKTLKLICFPLKACDENKGDGDQSNGMGTYDCPVYMTSTRSNFVSSIRLPTSESPVECTLKAVALIVKPL